MFPLITSSRQNHPSFQIINITMYQYHHAHLNTIHVPENPAGARHARVYLATRCTYKDVPQKCSVAKIADDAMFDTCQVFARLFMRGPSSSPCTRVRVSPVESIEHIHPPRLFMKSMLLALAASRARLKNTLTSQLRSRDIYDHHHHAPPSLLSFFRLLA